MWKDVHLAGSFEGYRAGFGSLFCSDSGVAFPGWILHGIRPCEYRGGREHSDLTVPVLQKEMKFFSSV